jgi:hypothetical protein
MGLTGRIKAMDASLTRAFESFMFIEPVHLPPPLARLNVATVAQRKPAGRKHHVMKGISRNN